MRLKSLCAVSLLAHSSVSVSPFPSGRHSLISIRGGSSKTEESLADKALTHNINGSSTDFAILKEEKVYDGKYRQILRKDIKFPNDHINAFEVLSNNACPSVSMFVWDTKRKVCTLVQEYHPGPEKLLYGTINGQYEESEGGKHTSAKECAAFELAEEARLEAREEDIISMLPEGVTTPMDKYTDNRFHPFLVLNPVPVSAENERPQDEEEYITVKEGLTYDDLMALISGGKINVVSTYTILLGLKTLEKLGIEYR